jgi:hypothetical protein
MANVENNFNSNDYSIIAPAGNEVNPSFSGSETNTYFRVTIFSQSQDGLTDTIVRTRDGSLAIFYSTNHSNSLLVQNTGTVDGITDILLPENNQFTVYTNQVDNSLYIKPNEILASNELQEGNYVLKLDVLKQHKPKVALVNDLETLPFPEFQEEFDIVGDFDDIHGEINASDSLQWSAVGRPDIYNYINSLVNDGIIDSIPRASDEGVTPRPVEDFYNNHIINDRFIIREISPTRLEVRLKLLSNPIELNSVFINELTKPSELGDGSLTENYNWVLNLGLGKNVPIVNYTLDKFSDGENNQSVILKLYQPLSNDIYNQYVVTLDKELLATQKVDIYYIEEPEVLETAQGLEIDSTENWSNTQGLQDATFQSFNELSSSLSQNSLHNIYSGSSYNYPNLKVDFNEFENHTFFGSAKRKLVNFKNKVKTIQGHYSNISRSLSADGVSFNADSDAVIDYRKTLFNKIDAEINSFTPYEKFLYFDGQTESTASAPGLGKNYAPSMPVNLGKEGVELIQHDGFNVVYKHTSEKISGTHNRYMSQFTNKYHAHNKPFFNYSSSVYLSYLIKSSIPSQSINWENRNPTQNNNLGFCLPKRAFYSSSILEPAYTSSEYRRIILKASQSYWAPTAEVNYDAGNIGDWSYGSSQYTIINNSTSASIYGIKASGHYQNLATVKFEASESATAFSGSIMPAGELFRVYHINNLSSSLIGYYDYQGVTIDDNDFEVFDKSGNGNTLEFAGAGVSSNAFTSASITTGVQGGDAFAFTTSGSLLGLSGSMYLSTATSTAPIESAPISMSAVAGDDVTGFTMATYYKSISTKTATTILGMDIKSGSTDVNGWHVNRIGDAIGAEITREGTNILDNDTSEDGLKTGTLTPRDGNFHHIALTYDNLTGTGSVYFDGVLQKQGNSRGFITGSNQIYRFVVGTGPGSAHGYDDDTFDETRFYSRALTPSEVNQLYLAPDGITKTKITDVKVTLQNPTDVLPFDNLYHTSSANWTNWYDGMYLSASAFDDDNIHSLENNLPSWIKTSLEYDSLKDFLSLQGEQFDLIRNHIDGIGTFHNRNYKSVDSVPENLLPMILQNMGWSPVDPYSGSLADYFGQNISSVTDINTIKENTWRKSLNNLIYLYKSKGTKNAVRALLNIYGYPPDVLTINEFGGSNDNQIDNTDGPITDEIETESWDGGQGSIDNDTDLENNKNSGNISYVLKRRKLYHYRFINRENRILNTSWWYNGVNADTIEFVYKHVKTKNTQDILKSSGSGTETLWDLRLIPDNEGVSSSFQFRLNNSSLGGNSISSRGYSMSLDYNKINEGELWNVMVQRMTSSISGTGIQKYRLYAGLQEGKKIKRLSFASMSISGGLSADNAKYANQNWVSTGSRNNTSSSNLIVGRTTSGSLAELRTWKHALSTSKFRLHTLNKFSTVGNSLNSHKQDLIYRYKLNENYTTASVSSSTQTTLTIKDSGPKCNLTSSYHITVPSSEATSSLLYGYDVIDANNISLQDAAVELENDSKIVVDPKLKLVGNLSPFKSSVVPLWDSTQQKGLRNNSSIIEINRSPQDFVNNFILEKIQGNNLEKLYGNPQYIYSSSYSELDTFRESFFDCYPITINTNDFIKAHENLFNQSLTEGIKNIVPARSTLSDKNTTIGITIKPTILEKQKRAYGKHSVETNPGLATGSIEITKNTDYKSGFGLSESSYDASINAEIFVTSGSDGNINLDDSELVTSKDGEIVHTDMISLNNSKQISTYDGEVIMVNEDIPVNIEGSVEMPVSGTNNYISTHWNKSFENIHDSWGTSSSDTHFINYLAQNHQTSSDGNYNVNHIERRFHFYSVGDVEIYSGSRGSGSAFAKETDFTDASRFHNRQIISDFTHKNTRYDSYINGNPGTQVGRALGKTLFYSASADGGTIYLPSNHISNFSYPFKEKMYEGAQNTDPGILSFGTNEDYSTASFYRVKVTGGENQLIVQTNTQPTIDDNDKIIRG